MANLLLHRTQQIFCCSCFARTFPFARSNSNCLFSPSTFTEKFSNAVVNTTIISASTRNRMKASTLRKLHIRNPQVVLSRSFYTLSHKNFVNLSIQKAGNVQQIQLHRRKARVGTTLIISSCSFHSSPPRYVSPLVWMVVKPVAKLIALLGGR